MTKKDTPYSALTLSEFTRRSLIVTACALAVILLTWFFWTTAHAALLIFSAFLVAVGLNGLARLTQRALPISRHGAVAVVATVLALFLGLSITAITMNIASQAPELKQQVAQSIDQLQSRLDDYKMTQTFLSSSVMGESGQGESGQSIGQRLTGKLSGAVSVTMSTLTDFFVIVIIGLYLATGSFDMRLWIETPPLTGLAAIVRASRSSLNAHRSSTEPPPVALLSL